MLNGPSFIPQTVKKILIMLHGYGANGDDLFDLNMLEEMYNKAEKDKSDTVVCEFYEYNEVNMFST